MRRGVGIYDIVSNRMASVENIPLGCPWAPKILLGAFNDVSICESHFVTVTIKNGVATLQGTVFDDWDLRQAMRISKKVAAVKRVVNDLDIKLGGE